MKPITTSITLLFFVGSMFYGQDKHETVKPVMLPNSNLMTCSAAQVLSDERVEAGSLYPVQVALDHFDKRGCPQGIVAIYDKAVSIGEIEASLDRRYGKWAMAGHGTAALKTWRVEPEKFAIQLSTIRDSRKKMGTIGERGMKQVIYLSFSLSK